MSETGYHYKEHSKPYKYQEGEYTVTRGKAWTAPGCHIGCDVLLYTDKDDNLAKVEGDPESPYNQGRLCARCLDLKEVTYSKDRILYPLKRAREDRGKDKWERVTWDEAVDYIVENMDAIRKAHGPESFVFTHGTGRDVMPYLDRIAYSYGSPNTTGLFSGMSCYVPRIAGMSTTAGSLYIADASQGWLDRYDYPEYEVPEIMVIWGNNPIIANADGFFGHWVIDLMKRGMKLIVIDPRITWLGARAEMRLRVRPGTDAALALGMLHVIINEDLYDHEFVEKWCYGFDELAERAQEYPPEKVAKICWLEEADIIEAARMIARAKPATLQWGVAIDQTKEAMAAGQAVTAIFEITGNMEVPGGLIANTQILDVMGGMWGYEFLSEEQREKRIVDKYPVMKVAFRSASDDQLIETMETGIPYSIHGIWMQGHNPISCMSAEPKRVYNILKNLDFNVTCELFMTPTAMGVCDVVLPVTTYPERDGLSLVCGIQQAGAINKVTQVGECKSDMEINLLVGKRLNPEAWPWDNVQDLFTDLLTDSGMTFEELRPKAPAYVPFEYRRHEKGLLRPDGQPGFNTPTGRIELWCTFYHNMGLDPLPYFEEPEPGPTSTPEMLDEYPLILTTGARRWASFHSEHRQIPRLRAMHPEPVLDIHPVDAQRYGLEQREWVWVENYLGRAKCQVNPTYEMPEGIVSCDHAWWHPEGDPENLYDVFDLNINNLVPFGNPGKSGFGANYKTSLVKIYKVKDGE
jgi:anaerobic selenocysteine-containing dehydrogenase